MPLESINGTMLYYETYGTGIPIVFIHPPLLTSANFSYQQMQLSDQFQVITFDIRGHGRSQPSNIPLSYALITEDMKQLLDHLNIEKAIICGYSAGGSIALEAMLAHSDRFWGGILISTMSEASDFVLRNRIRLAIGMSGWQPLMRLLMLGITWGNADSAHTFRNLLHNSQCGNTQNIQEYYKFSLNYNCTNQLSKINTPVLLLYGDKDRGFIRYRKILQQGLRHFKLILIQNVKHQLPTKAAAEINQVMRNWIQEQSGNLPTDIKESDFMPEAYIAAQERSKEQNQISD
ncbi:alpha/beta hydrolase [Paenibacillus selenitireducens]|uniref:Alpha/beta hydrolase n=1 Tax=Paenibacillus selenitireducens TaxID=1324314 RepID=A0A1T2XD60_9BACL|nr:alpha/beta hydrolase [Paenibacillus selenitireducens]OPA77775.1 alpha/beta hydrolase [Paenibacillus selenitireducens]